MSKFLAPIHTWLFNKIIILETIEKEILKSASVEDQAVHETLVDQLGSFIPDSPIEDLIDQSNIHGWLQDRIILAESRQAAYISKTNQDLEVVAHAYAQVGKAVATMEASNPEQAFNALNNVLLEGMPCDRVNFVLDKDETFIKWKTTNCVHKTNWESNGTPVVYYYKFREAFTRAFVETLGYSYSYENADQQEHEIKVK